MRKKGHQIVQDSSERKQLHQTGPRWTGRTHHQTWNHVNRRWKCPPTVQVSCCERARSGSEGNLTCAEGSLQEAAELRRVRRMVEAASGGWCVRESLAAGSCQSDQKDRWAERTVRWNVVRATRNRVRASRVCHAH